MRAEDVVRLRLAQVVAERRPRLPLAAVEGAAAELYAEQPSEYALAVRAVRAFVVAPVAQEDAPRALVVHIRERARRDRYDAAEARGDEVERVVELRRRVSEIVIALVVVAYHRIHRARGLEEPREERRLPAERAERHVEKHRYYAVDVAFRYSLDRRAHDAALGEPLRVASDDAADLAARAFEVALREQPRDWRGFVLERLEGYRRVEQVDVDRRVCPLAYEGCER